jgi:hypothetical protein
MDSLEAMLTEAEHQGWLPERTIGSIPELIGIYTGASKYFVDLILETEPVMRETMTCHVCRYLFAKGVEGVILWGLSKDGNVSVYFHPKHLVGEIETEVPPHLHSIVIQSLSVGESLFWAHNRFIMKQQENGSEIDYIGETATVLRWLPKLGISYALFKRYHELG